MSELRLWSVTTLLRAAFGVGEAIVYWTGTTTAAAAYDRFNILRQFVDDGDRDGAIEWLSKERFKKTGAAMARGTDLHHAAEALALGQQPEIDPANQPYLDQYTRFLEEHEPEFLMAEIPCYNVAHAYAGTCDGIMVVGGQRLVFDIKTTDKHPDSGRKRPPYSETALQVCAYRRATEVGLLTEQRVDGRGGRYYLYDPDGHHEPMPETDGAAILVVSPFDYMLVPCRTDDEVWRHVLYAFQNARWQLEVSRSVYGPPVTATTRETVA